MLTLKLTMADKTTAWFTGTIRTIEERLDALAATGGADEIISWEFV